MFKRISLLLGVLAASALAVVAVMAQTGAGLSNACRTIDGQAGSVVRIGVPDDAVAGGAGLAGCRVVHDGNSFVLSPAVIGDLGVIRRGVNAAVSIFGISSGGAVDNFGTEVQMCLRGTGTFIWINTVTNPRLVSEMPAVTRELELGTYTCTFISSTGIAVLVNGPAAPSETTTEITVDEAGVNTVDPSSAAPAEDGVAATVGATPLSGCRITTTAMVRLREEPNTQSGIVTRLPYEINLQATAQTEGWVQVIWQARQGWVSDRYVSYNEGCFND